MTAWGRAPQTPSTAGVRPSGSSAQCPSTGAKVGPQASNGARDTTSHELSPQPTTSRAARIVSRASLLMRNMLRLRPGPPAHTAPRTPTSRSREDEPCAGEERVMNLVEHRPGAHSSRARASHSAARRARAPSWRLPPSAEWAPDGPDERARRSGSLLSVHKRRVARGVEAK